MRRTITWLVVGWVGVCSAWGQDASSADNVRKGHRLAIMVCAFCHVAGLRSAGDGIVLRWRG